MSADNKNENVCDRCGKSFKYPSLLKNHLASKKPCVAAAAPVVEETKPVKEETKPKKETKSKKEKKEKTEQKVSEEAAPAPTENADETEGVVVHEGFNTFHSFLESFADNIKSAAVRFVSREIAKDELIKQFNKTRFRFRSRTALSNLYPENESLENLSKIINSIEALMDYDQMEYDQKHHLCQCNKCGYIFTYPRDVEEPAFCMDCKLRDETTRLMGEDKLDEALAVQREYMGYLYHHRLGDILYRTCAIVYKQEEINDTKKELEHQKIELTKEVMAIVQARNLLPMSNITVNSTTTSTTTTTKK